MHTIKVVLLQFYSCWEAGLGSAKRINANKVLSWNCNMTHESLDTMESKLQFDLEKHQSACKSSYKWRMILVSFCPDSIPALVRWSCLWLTFPGPFFTCLLMMFCAAAYYSFEECALWNESDIMFHYHLYAILYQRCIYKVLIVWTPGLLCDRISRISSVYTVAHLLGLPEKGPLF